MRTDRLLLRRWREEDREPFAAINADPAVMEHFPSTLTAGQSDAMVDRIEASFAEHGFGLWVVELAATGEFLGYTGLSARPWYAHLTPAVEVGWRLARQAWGRGYASEAARRALEFGFTAAGLAEIASVTTPANQRSIAVMCRLGMTRDPADDFDHPNIEPGHPLRRHVLYRITAHRWKSQQQS